MSTLAVAFGEILLRNPIVMASAPPTETAEHIARGADAGAAAAITKTSADFAAHAFPLGGRRVLQDKRGLWALSTFRRETMSMEAGAALVAGAVKRTDIPIIASVGALDMNPDSWLPTCQVMQESGAAAIQLDLFYLPQPRCSPRNISDLLSLLKYLAGNLHIPLFPKLNLDLPAYFAAEMLLGSPIAGIFAIDSIRVPAPLDLSNGMNGEIVGVQNAAECSLFGSWQKPITLQYTRVLAEQQPLPICAGGGFMTGLDAAEAILLGATGIQFATAIIQHGFPRIGKILRELERYMDENEFVNVAAMRGAAIRRFVRDERHIVFDDLKAAVKGDACTMCGRCTRQVFCPSIQVTNGQVDVLASCEGCGLCVATCPTEPKALSLVPRVDRKQLGPRS